MVTSYNAIFKPIVENSVEIVENLCLLRNPLTTILPVAFQPIFDIGLHLVKRDTQSDRQFPEKQSLALFQKSLVGGAELLFHSLRLLLFCIDRQVSSTNSPHSCERMDSLYFSLKSRVLPAFTVRVSIEGILSISAFASSFEMTGRIGVFPFTGVLM